MPKALFAYWDTRGLAQPIRLLLEHTGEDYEEKKYSLGPAPHFDNSSWLTVKQSIGLDFPNLPYYINGDVKLTQSNAIIRHIARKNDLCGKTENEKVKVDLLAEQAMDFRNGFARLCYNPNFESLKDEYLKSIQDKLKEFSNFIGKSSWFTGESITFADFIIYELLDQHRLLSSKLLDPFQNLRDFLDRFEKLPKIAKYMKSERFIHRPINNKMAAFK
ncbi:GST [Lepeophtheirus salmonis]|uniref:Glutathione S-transferase n=2 Tax=Lepeophtheirus salmonis TaxID=72036 RepID=A0A7R8HDR8_LEPSM|nr:glutathione S-transferase-like [Lepeophtheirus salmonis]CAB4069505.1 GST [Lepeophtheirus salmonis]CAF3028467.1 GST [Lepeophtheirus salmonis]